MESKMAGLLVSPGRVVGTPNALNALAEAGVEPMAFISRHASGDWGTLDAHDTAANRSAMKSGARIMSVYPFGSGQTLWIISDAVDGDPRIREVTTLLLPEDY